MSEAVKTQVEPAAQGTPPGRPRKKFICLAVPTLGVVSMEWARRLRAVVWPLNTGYVDAVVHDDVGGQIAVARNLCVQLALSYESESREISHIFWLDDDVLALPSVLLALIRHDADIASGVYFTKSELPQPLIFPGRGMGTAPWTPDKVLRTWGHGMGLTLVKTGVYKRMLAEGLPRDAKGNPEWYRTPDPATDATVEDGSLMCGGTEDLYFLNRAWEMGYRPVVDCTRYAFGWHYDYQRQVGYPREQWEQHRKRQPVRWQTPDGEVVWGS